MTNDDMVDEMDLQQVRCLTQCACETAIGVTGCGIARWMIVGNGEGEGSISEHLLQDLARMSNALIESTLEQSLAMNEAELGIQKQHMHLFVVQRLHLAREVIEDALGLVHRLVANRFTCRSLTNLESCSEDGGLRRTKAFRTLEISYVSTGQLPQSAALTQQAMADLDGVLTGDAGVNEDAQEFRIGEGFGPVREQSLTWTIFLRNVVNAVAHAIFAGMSHYRAALVEELVEIASDLD